jgi:antitoxin component YwqK of YwqJK toxin-antitoxin module
MRTAALLVLMVFVGVFAIACPKPLAPPAELPPAPQEEPADAGEVSPDAGELSPDPGALPEKCEKKSPWKTSETGTRAKQGEEWVCYSDGGWNYARTWRDGKKHGTYAKWYENGHKKAQGGFRDGQRHGKWFFWYENGQKSVESNYRDGKEHGTYAGWYENGHRKAQGDLHDENKHGEWVFWYENGQKSGATDYRDGKEHGAHAGWYENGHKKAQGEFHDANKHGKWAWWDENGQKSSEAEYLDGKKEGKYTKWHENGQKNVESNYLDGEKHGKYTEWHENGQKSSEVEYRDGKWEGKYTEWHENGQKSSEVEYRDGEREGKYTGWHEDGQKKEEGQYSGGVEMSALLSVLRKGAGENAQFEYGRVQYQGDESWLTLEGAVVMQWPQRPSKVRCGKVRETDASFLHFGGAQSFVLELGSDGRGAFWEMDQARDCAVRWGMVRFGKRTNLDGKSIFSDRGELNVDPECYDEDRCMLPVLRTTVDLAPQEGEETVQADVDGVTVIAADGTELAVPETPAEFGLGYEAWNFSGQVELQIVRTDGMTLIDYANAHKGHTYGTEPETIAHDFRSTYVYHGPAKSLVPVAVTSKSVWERTGEENRDVQGETSLHVVTAERNARDWGAGLLLFERGEGTRQTQTYDVEYEDDGQESVVCQGLTIERETSWTWWFVDQAGNLKRLAEGERESSKDARCAGHMLKK